MAFHDASIMNEKEAVHEKLVQSDTVSEHNSQPFGNKADGTCHQPSTQSDLCDPGQRLYQIHGQLACNPAFTQATEPMKDLISYQCIPELHFCQWNDSQGELDLASQRSHDTSMQYQLGTRLTKVNMTKVRKDETIPIEKNMELIFFYQMKEHHCRRNKAEDLTSIPEQAHRNCVRKGQIHVLEISAGSARFCQCCALTGLLPLTSVQDLT